MGDVSQSRYSIVERLTQTKLEIISAKSQLDADITTKKQNVEEAKEAMKDWDLNIKSEVDRKRKEQQRNVQKLERDAKNTAERKKIKEDTYDKKIQALDKALEQIQKISESAPAAN